MRKLYLLLVVLILGVIFSCTKDTSELELFDISSKGDKIQVCHYDEKNSSWELIHISVNAIEGHKKHGDVIIDEDGDGYALYNECGILNSNGIDCDDKNGNVHPNADEICGDGIDNDCDGIIDECGTYVPDDNFEQALIDLGYDVSPLDDYVPTENIENIMYLYINNLNINDLTGIEDFKNLRVLYCYKNNLTQLDVSNNPKLVSLNCNENKLSSIDVSMNDNLWYLYCGNNNLTSLKVSNKNLIHLYCFYNPITNLDVTDATALKKLSCYGTDLTSLDVTKNLALEMLVCNGSNFDSLDVSNNLALTGLSCNNSQLSSIDVSNNTALQYLNCGWNNITELDVSNNPNLISLFCYDNDLIKLNVKNGNNTNFIYFKASLNPKLTCIEVDNAIWSTANWTEIDALASFSENCSSGSNLY